MGSNPTFSASFWFAQFSTNFTGDGRSGASLVVPFRFLSSFRGHYLAAAEGSITRLYMFVRCALDYGWRKFAASRSCRGPALRSDRRSSRETRNIGAISVAKLNVNGAVVEVDAAGDTPLLWVIREQLGMTGTKYGCGVAQCGACTVHVDGVAVRSCGVPLSQVTADQKITTIEGLSQDGSHPVQKAWLAMDVPQCGYCQTGMIMTAAALLAQTPKPTDAEIDLAMTNICRCGTYLRVRAAIHAAAAATAAPATKKQG